MRLQSPGEEAFSGGMNDALDTEWDQLRFVQHQHQEERLKTRRMNLDTDHCWNTDDPKGFANLFVKVLSLDRPSYPLST